MVTQAENATFSPPPILKKDQREKFIDELSWWVQDLHVWQQDLQGAIERGWLINTARVISLDADVITAGSTFTQNLTIGAGSPGITISGTTTNILINDGTRDNVILGNLGAAGNGVQVLDSSGTVVFQASDVGTFIDGAIITNATISSSKIISIDGSIIDTNTISSGSIINLDGAKIQSATIDSAQIATAAIDNVHISNVNAGKINAGILNAAIVSVINLNAGNITTGTLTANGSPVAIDITGSGAFTASGGGDIKLTAATGDFNYVEFYSATSSLRGILGLFASGSFYTMRAPNIATGLWLDSFADVLIYAGTNDDIILGDNVVTNTIRIRGELEPFTDSTYGIGNAGIEWVDVWADDSTINDLQFGNNWVLTEASEAFMGVGLDEGLVLLDNSEPSNVVAVFSQDGNMYVSGEIKPLTDWVHNNKARKQTSVERKRTQKYVDSYVLQPNNKWIRKKKAGYVRNPKTKEWNIPDEFDV